MKEVQKEIQALKASESERLREIEFCKMQLDELAAAELQVGLSPGGTHRVRVFDATVEQPLRRRERDGSFGH